MIAQGSGSESLPLHKINQFLAARRVTIVFILYFFGRFQKPLV